MAIDRQVPVTKPAIDYNKDHVDHFQLKVSRKTGKYDVTMHTVPASLDGGPIECASKEHEESMATTDFETDAVVYALATGQAVDVPDAVSKRIAAKAAVAAEIAEGIDIFTHMARFEAALAEIKNIMGESTTGIS